MTALLWISAWVGHAYLVTGALNALYSRPIAKAVLRATRLLAGAVIGAFPLLAWWPAGPYVWLCAAVGAGWFPLVTAYRLLRRPADGLIAERTETIDFGAELGPAAVGDGKWAWLARRLPVNHVFRCDFTEIELSVPGLPASWDGLSIHLLTDLHFCGTPSREWHERVLARVRAWPAPDLVVLGGDYVDTDDHHAWIRPLLAPLLEGGVPGAAVLGNHDAQHHPETIRAELASAGYVVLGNGAHELTLRGERFLAIGHEGPWIGRGPPTWGDPQLFRLLVSHTPDHFSAAARAGVGLTLAGHVHGGQVRLPVIGSIFVPSFYGRRFDMGVFSRGDARMVVSRGVSGKEPLRFRCNPQVIRLVLAAAPASRHSEPEA